MDTFPAETLAIIEETAKETASIMIVVCASALYGYLLVRTKLPTVFMDAIFTVTNKNPRGKQGKNACRKSFQIFPKFGNFVRGYFRLTAK